MAIIYRQYERKDTQRLAEHREENLMIKEYEDIDSSEESPKKVMIVLDKTRKEAVYIPFGSLIRIEGHTYRIHRGKPFVYPGEESQALRNPKRYFHHQTLCLEGEDMQWYRLETFNHKTASIVHNQEEKQET